MLRIKDNIDLRELEKFGFKLSDNSNVYFYKVLDGNFIQVWTGSKGIWYVANLQCEKLLDKLYDLIQAGLVEKIEE